MPLTYLPGNGSEVAINATAKGIVEVADFGRESSAIGLGEPPIQEINSGLLSGGC